MSGIHVLVINGPNLNLLGTREPQTYGYDTLSDVESKCKKAAEAAGGKCSTFQSNYEGAIVERIHAAKAEGVDGIVINAGAYTHTSVAIRDALLGVTIPFVELHISNVHAREAFRHHSYLSDKAVAVVCGLGVSGYGKSGGHANNVRGKTDEISVQTIALRTYAKPLRSESRT